MAIEERNLPAATLDISTRRESTVRTTTLLNTAVNEANQYNLRILIVPFLSRYHPDTVRKIMTPSRLSKEELEKFNPPEPWYH